MKGAPEPLATIYEVVGDDAVLLPVPTGEKKPIFHGWQKTTHAQTLTKEWWARLCDGNIGVLLGMLGNGVVTIDCDTDEFAAEVVAANPAFAKTLQTRGERGRNFWLRCIGEFPRLRTLKNRTGEKLGEWRSDGGQTIIEGVHPSGCPYRIIEHVPAITVSFSGICWPASVAKPPTVRSALLQHRSTEAQKRRDTDAQRLRDTRHVVVPCVLDVAPFLPSAQHRNNDALFILARAILDVERTRNAQLNADELRAVFASWHRQNLHLRPDISFDAYYAEFINACNYARVPLSESSLTVAIAAASREPPPPEAERITDEKMRLLIGICWQLQCLTAPKPFFLACREAAIAIGVDSSTAHRWLISFCERRSGFLDCTKRGSYVTGEANEYRFRRVAVE